MPRVEALHAPGVSGRCPCTQGVGPRWVQGISTAMGAAEDVLVDVAVGAPPVCVGGVVAGGIEAIARAGVIAVVGASVGAVVGAVVGPVYRH